MARIYLLYGLVVIGGLAYADWGGFGLTSYDELKEVPKTIRNNPGAYREMYSHRYFHK
jgi:hypothetical protein